MKGKKKKKMKSDLRSCVNREVDVKHHEGKKKKKMKSDLRSCVNREVDVKHHEGKKEEEENEIRSQELCEQGGEVGPGSHFLSQSSLCPE